MATWLAQSATKTRIQIDVTATRRLEEPAPPVGSIAAAKALPQSAETKPAATDATYELAEPTAETGVEEPTDATTQLEKPGPETVQPAVPTTLQQLKIAGSERTIAATARPQPAAKRIQLA